MHKQRRRLSPAPRGPRRRESIALGVAASLLGAPEPVGSTPAIPKELAFQREVLADEQNAGVEWQKAVPLYVTPESAVRDAMEFAWTRGGKPLTEEQRIALERWLERSRATLEQIELSLRKPKAQWRGRTPGGDLDPALTVVHFMVKARAVQAAQLAERSNYDAAVENLLGSLRLAELATNGDGAVIHFLVGHSCERLALGAIQELALETDAPAKSLARLLAGLERPSREVEAYTRAIQVEFHDYVLHHESATEMAESFRRGFSKSGELALFTIPEEFRVVYRTLLTPSLVAGHPMPLDHDKLVAAAIPRLQLHLANARGPWKDRAPAQDEAGEVGKKFLKDTAKLTKGLTDESFPLSEGNTDRLRPAYNRFENPVGRLLEALPDGLAYTPARVFRARTEREATRAIVGLRLFFLKEKRWPDSLHELVERGVLEAVPRDPFGEGELDYSRAKLLLWSVGENGVDDGGKEVPESRWQSGDVVWNLNPNKGSP